MTCRDLILARIPELRQFGSATHVLFYTPRENPSKRQKARERKMADEGKWPENFDFSALDDEALTKAFEKLVHWSYKSWA